jgi:hypothetical protein
MIREISQQLAMSRRILELRVADDPLDVKPQFGGRDGCFHGGGE